MERKKRCFVIMPFSKTSQKRNEKYWNDFFESFIKITVESLGYECERSAARPTDIIKSIIDNLYTADFVIAVLTDNNPNVWYELGIRHSLNYGTIMIIDEKQKIPFDVAYYGVIKYNIKKQAEFRKRLSEFFQALEQFRKLDNPVGDFLSGSLIQTAKCTTAVVNSPLTFEKVLDIAKEDVLIVGQNLGSLATDSRFKRTLLKTLETRKIDIQILLCDPNVNYVVKAVQEFTAPSFKKDLNTVCNIFKEWHLEIERDSHRYIGTFEVRVSEKIGNISLTFVDRRDQNGNGHLLITPVAWQMSPGSKPCIWFNNMIHKEIFRIYYTSYDVIWRHARNLFRKTPNRFVYNVIYSFLPSSMRRGPMKP